ncbi:hypothetical protein V6N13_054396 [Hibiscus sabdariffa]
MHISWLFSKVKLSRAIPVISSPKAVPDPHTDIPAPMSTSPTMEGSNATASENHSTTNIPSISHSESPMMNPDSSPTISDDVQAPGSISDDTGSCVANAADDGVLDANGEVVRTGVRYYVVPVILGIGGGGLAIGRESGRPCPEIVVQRPSDTDQGIPVVFSNPNPDGDVVRLSSDVQVKFDGPRDSLCPTSMVWKLQHYDESVEKTWVELGGAEGRGGSRQAQ